jgi:hypothetical protein
VCLFLASRLKHSDAPTFYSVGYPPFFSILLDRCAGYEPLD